MTTRNEIYIGALIDYVNDVKPFHTKLTQVVEEHQFFDTVNVSVSERLNTSIHLNSVWKFDNYYSDGLRTRYQLPPFLTPRYSTDIANYRYSSAGQLDYLSTNFGLDNAFQVNASQGLETVLIDGNAGLEGYDFYLSKGMFSFETVGTNLRQTNSDIVEDGSVHWISTNPWMQVSDLVIPAGGERMWEIKMLQTEDLLHVLYTGQRVSITLENQAAPNVFYETYENNRLVIPNSVVQIPGETITFNFNHAALRVVKITAEGDANVFNFDTPSTTWEIFHSIGTTKIIPQAYKQIGTEFHAILPQSMVIVDAGTIIITFSQPTAGKVILRDVPSQIEFTNVDHIDIAPFHGELINYGLFLQTGISEFTYTLVTDEIHSTYLRINLGSPQSGFINYMTSVEPKAQFVVTDIVLDEVVGIGVYNEPFYNLAISFTPTFGGLLEAGTSTIIRPGNQIAVLNSAIDQVWSIIKINPISYSKPTLASLETRLQLIPYAPAFRDAAAETWVFTFNGVSFNVVGSVSGSNFATMKIGSWYDNGLIRVKLVLDSSLNYPFVEKFINNEAYLDEYNLHAVSLLNLEVGDTFIFNVLEDRPSYIVYGSVSKQIEFATVGKYFWNGQIGFMPDLPYYSITPVNEMQPEVLSSEPSMNTGLMRNVYYDEFAYGEIFETDILATIEGRNTVNNNPTWFLMDYYPTQWNIKLGVPLVQQSLHHFYNPATLQVNFYQPPRFDAVDERFDLVLNDHITTGDQQFFVNSSLAGPLPAAIVGYTYTNFETAALSLTYGNAGALNIELLSNDTIPSGTSLTVAIKSNFIKPFHSKDVVIIDPLVTYTDLVLRTFNNDQLELNIVGSYPELGNGNGYGDENTLQTFLMPRITNANYNEGYDVADYDVNPYEQLEVFGESLATSTQPLLPSRYGTYDLLLNNSPFANAGTISYQLDTTSGLYYCVIDFTTEFLNKYLPTNTKFSVTSHQTDEYNHVASVMITEQLKISNVERKNDSIIPTVTDGELSIIDRTVSYNSAGGKDAIIFEKISGFPSNLTGYDLLSYDNDPFDIFSDSVPHYTYAITDYPSPGVKCWYRVYEYNVTQITIEIPQSIVDITMYREDNIVILANYDDTSMSHALDNTVTLQHGTDYIIDGIDYTGLGYFFMNTFQVQFTLANVPRFVIVMVLDYASIPTSVS